MSNSSANPAGSLFGQSSALAGGVITDKPDNKPLSNEIQKNNNDFVNNPQNINDTILKKAENNDPAQLAEMLTTGAVLIDHEDEGKNKNITNTNPQEFKDEKGNIISQEQSIINELAKDYKGETFLPDDVTEKITEGITNGNLSPLTEAMEAVGNNAFARAMQSFLKLIPEIINSTEMAVLDKVGSQNQVNDVWSEFMSAYPGYSRDNALAKEHVIKGIEGGRSKEEVFAAVDIIFSGTKKKQEADNQGFEKFSPEENSKPFDLDALINS